jgi:leader peptidase (prepilin peptidase)/N-methyltransferase
VDVMGPMMVLLGCGVFTVGTVVGSFLNVCIYRIPWEKSVIWPGSRCPRCLSPIAARDNIPILGWIALRGECRSCGARISARYPFVEFLVGFLFVGLFLVDVVYGPRGRYGHEVVRPMATMAYHAVFVSLLVAASFIDYDLYIIPDRITINGMIMGVLLGTVFPWIRPEPSTASTAWEGFKVGMFGLLVAGGFMEVVRRLANGAATFLKTLAAGKYTPVDAMGFGDVTLMAMIGAFMGWQGALLSFFVGPLFGFGQACWKLFIKLKKLVTGQKLSATDRELPFGPYLSLGAVALVLAWPWFWKGWGEGLFETLGWMFWFMLGVNSPFPGEHAISPSPRS